VKEGKNQGGILPQLKRQIKQANQQQNPKKTNIPQAFAPSSRGLGNREQQRKKPPISIFWRVDADPLPVVPSLSHAVFLGLEA
jgi:hypothetical protein